MDLHKLLELYSRKPGAVEAPHQLAGRLDSRHAVDRRVDRAIAICPRGNETWKAAAGVAVEVGADWATAQLEFAHKHRRAYLTKAERLEIENLQQADGMSIEQAKGDLGTANL